jgi:hypothetical protein
MHPTAALVFLFTSLAVANQDMYCLNPGSPSCSTVDVDVAFTRNQCSSCGGAAFNTYWGALCSVNGQTGACFAHACDTTHKSKHCFYTT